LIPDAREWIDAAPDFGEAERFAQFLVDLPQDETPKYKALLKAAGCSDLKTARLAAGDCPPKADANPEKQGFEGKGAIAER
jgi:hypothetical protein